jgi:hypothetical protein
METMEPNTDVGCSAFRMFSVFRMRDAAFESCSLGLVQRGFGGESVEEIVPQIGISIATKG